MESNLTRSLWFAPGKTARPWIKLQTPNALLKSLLNECKDGSPSGLLIRTSSTHRRRGGRRTHITMHRPTELVLSDVPHSTLSSRRSCSTSSPIAPTPIGWLNLAYRRPRRTRSKPTWRRRKRGGPNNLPALLTPSRRWPS